MTHDPPPRDAVATDLSEDEIESLRSLLADFASSAFNGEAGSCLKTVCPVPAMGWGSTGVNWPHSPASAAAAREPIERLCEQAVELGLLVPEELLATSPGIFGTASTLADATALSDSWIPLARAVVSPALLRASPERTGRFAAAVLGARSSNHAGCHPAGEALAHKLALLRVLLPDRQFPASALSDDSVESLSSILGTAALSAATLTNPEHSTIHETFRATFRMFPGLPEARVRRPEGRTVLREIVENQGLWILAKAGIPPETFAGSGHDPQRPDETLFELALSEQARMDGRDGWLGGGRFPNIFSERLGIPAADANVTTTPDRRTLNWRALAKIHAELGTERAFGSDGNAQRRAMGSGPDAWAASVLLAGGTVEDSRFLDEAWFGGLHPWILAANPVRAHALSATGRHPWSEPRESDGSGTLGLLESAATAAAENRDARDGQNDRWILPHNLRAALRSAAEACDDGHTLPGSDGILHRCIRENLPGLFAALCDHADAFGIDPNQPSDTGRHPMDAAIGMAAKHSGTGRECWAAAAKACALAGGSVSAAPASGTAAFDALCERFRKIFVDDPETASIVERAVLDAKPKTKKNNLGRRVPTPRSAASSGRL